MTVGGARLTISFISNVNRWDLLDFQEREKI